MESTSKKQNTPKLWYWGEPKGGMSRLADMYIAFV